MPLLTTTKKCSGPFGTRLWILPIVTMLSLTACTSLDRVVCYGTGTCDRDPRWSTVGTVQSINTMPQTVITNTGTYLIVKDSSGSVNALIQTSKGK